MEEADCTKWVQCPTSAKYYLGQECNAEGKVCASYLSESVVLSSITLSLDVTSSNILKHLKKCFKHNQAEINHVNTYYLIMFRYLKRFSAASLQGYGSKKRSCLHWVNCKNTCYCARWSKLLEEGSEVEEKA